MRFFLLGKVDILLYFLAVRPSVEEYLLSLLLLLRLMQQRYLRFLVHFHLQSHLLVLLRLHVATALVYYIAGLLPGLFDLSECP